MRGDAGGRCWRPKATPVLNVTERHRKAAHEHPTHDHVLMHMPSSSLANHLVMLFVGIITPHYSTLPVRHAHVELVSANDEHVLLPIDTSVHLWKSTQTHRYGPSRRLQQDYTPTGRLAVEMKSKQRVVRCCPNRIAIASHPSR